MKQQGVYILQSLKNGRFYIGSTGYIDKRVIQHNRGQVKATRFMVPLKLKAFIPCDNMAEARKAEYRLKQYKRKDVIERVIKDKTFPWRIKGP